MSEFLIASLAFFCTVLALALLERLASRLRLLDYPNGHKTHSSPTPVVGGIGVVAILFGFGIIFEAPAGAAWLYGGIAGATLLGLIDDLRPLGAKTKLILMLGIFALTLRESGTLLVSLGELLPGTTVQLGSLALPFTLFAAVGVINAFNLIDGMDGLAGSVGLCVLSGHLLVANLIGATEWVPLLAVVIAATAAFLCFNLRVPGRSRARMFLGDAGSLALGFVMLWIAVDLTQRPSGAPPMVMVWLLALPMLDTVATMLLRIREGKSIFAPGHDHFHHLLRAHGASVERIVCTATVLSIGSATTGVLMWQAGVPDWVSLAAFLLVTAAYVRLHQRAWSKLGRGRRNAGAMELHPEQIA